MSPLCDFWRGEEGVGDFGAEEGGLVLVMNASLQEADRMSCGGIIATYQS